MKTLIKKLDRNKIDEQEITEAGQIIKTGGLVAFPTETVYGLGANALNEEGAKKIYEAKGRPSDNPLIIHIADRTALEEIAVYIPEETEVLMDHFWPGPLTMIFEKQKIVPYGTTGGLDTVAVRMPEDLIARALIIAGGGFVAAPSANTSGKPSPTSAQHVIDDLDGKINMILDGGNVDIGLESTILDMTVKPPMILRPGAITKEMIENLIGTVTIDRTILEEKSEQAPRAPGMKYRHYAPKAQMNIVEGTMPMVVKAIKIMAYELTRQGKKVGIIGTTETQNEYTTGLVKCIGSRNNEQGIAKNLYRLLREFDEEEVDYIYSEAFTTTGMGSAVMNRLTKAAGHNVVKAEDIAKKQSFTKIIIVSYNDTSRGPMAMELLKKENLLQEYEIESRGMIVLFPEPINPKIEVVMNEQGMTLSNHKSHQLEEKDMTEDTLILTIEETLKGKIVAEFDFVKQVYSLSEYVEDESVFTSIYGQPLEMYKESFEKIKKVIKKLVKKLNDEAIKN